MGYTCLPRLLVRDLKPSGLFPILCKKLDWTMSLDWLEYHTTVEYFEHMSAKRWTLIIHQLSSPEATGKTHNLN